jgi:aminopeptidase N
MPVTYFVYREDSAKAAADFRNTTALLGWFARTFGEYQFVAEKFGYAEVDGSLTMENQTIVSVERGLITGDGKHETTLIHEMSHHWWGNLITPASWHHTWLSEGMATLAEGLYIEHAKGPAAYGDYMRVLMDQPEGSYRGAVAGVSDTAFWDSFGAQVYFKGAIVLHMLRRTIGDSAFFGAIRSYLRDPALRYGNAATADFQRWCERSSGTSLDWFFRQWVYAVCDSVDRPALRLSWTSAPGATGATLRVTVRQSDRQPFLYRLPLTLTVAWAKGSKEFPVVVEERSHTFEFNVPEAPTAVVLDKDHDFFFTREQ